jgi:hypothetical protein
MISVVSGLLDKNSYGMPESGKHKSTAKNSLRTTFLSPHTVQLNAIQNGYQTHDCIYKPVTWFGLLSQHG